MPSSSPESGVPLAGQLVVFTGKLSSLGRAQARQLVTRLGGATADDVNAKTTMVVIGAEGFGPPAASKAADGLEAAPDAVEERLPGSGRSVREKSNKLKRAEDLNALPGAARQIRILTE